MMGWITQSRRRQIRAKGRTMQLMRPGGVSFAILAFAPPPQASQLTDGVPVAAFIAQTTADETGANGFTPKKGDRITDGPKTYTLTDASPVYDGSVICGWTLVSAGGQ